MDGTSPSGPLWPRPDIDAFSLAESLRRLVDLAHPAIGLDLSLLLVNDEASGSCCLVAATGVTVESREVLLGAGIGVTAEIAVWLRENGSGRSLVSSRLGAGTPFAVDEIVGGALEGEGRDGHVIVAPLVVRGKTIGVFSAYVYEVEETEAIEQRRPLIELVAANAAALIDQSMTTERATRRFESGQLLSRLANRIYRLNEPAEILAVTCDDVRDFLEADFCGVLRPTDDGFVVEQRSERQGVQVDVGTLPIVDRLEQARRHGIVVVETRPDERSSPTRSVLVAPILIRDQMHAVLTCANVESPRQWQTFELELLRGVADLLGVALSEARLHADEEMIRGDLECLLDASQALALTNDRDEALDALLMLAGNALGASSSAVLLADERNEELRVVASRGSAAAADGVRVAVTAPATAAEAFLNGHPVAAGAVPARPDRFVLSPASKCALAVPLQLGDRKLGILLVEGDESRGYTGRETALAMGLAHEAAVAVHRSALFDRVALGKREWEATFDAMVDAVVLFRRDGRVVRANRSAALAFGVEYSTLREATCCRLVCSETDGGSCATAEALETDAPVVRRTSLWGADFVLTVNPIRNRLGDPAGAVALLRQTQRLEGVDELDVRVARAVSRSRGAVLLLDRGSLVRWANPAAEELFGAALVPLAAFGELLDEMDRSRFETQLSRVATGEVPGVSVSARAGGTDLELQLSSAGDDARDELVLVLAREVATAAGGAGVTVLRHRGSGDSVFHLSRMLLGTLDESGRDSSARRRELVALVDRLDRAGRSKLDRVVEPVELNRIAEDAIEATRPLWNADAAARGVVFDVRLEPCRSARALGCASELRDVFAELIRNAVEAQPNGGSIVIRTIDRRGLVGAQVRDDGGGIPVAIRSHALEPFVTTKGAPHAGLGLSIAAAVVARHGGRLSLRSVSGEGSSVHFVVPQYAGTPEGDGAPMEGGAVVLVDDRVLRLRILDAFEDGGLPAVWAADTRETVWAFDLHRPSMLVVDGGALEAASERVASICRTASASRACVLVAREVPAAAEPLVREGVLVVVRPDQLAELVRMASDSPR